LSELGRPLIRDAGFSPIPYRIFTVTAGVISMSPAPLILASLMAALMAALMAGGGERMEQTLRGCIDRIGWITVLMAALVILVYNH